MKNKEKKNESQLVPELRAVVLKKAGRQTLEKTEDGSLCFTDGWLTSWIVVYDEATWSHDGIFKINKPLIEKMNKISKFYI